MAHDVTMDTVHDTGKTMGRRMGILNRARERERESREIMFPNRAVATSPFGLPFYFTNLSIRFSRSRNETRRMRFGRPNSWVRECGTRELRGGIGPGGSGAKNGARIRTVTIAKCQVFVVSWL